MNISCGKRAPSYEMAGPASVRTASRFKVILSAVLVLAASVAMAPAARADSYAFSFSGGGLSGSGVFEVSNAVVPGVPGAHQVTGISGTFSDATAGLSNAAITGLVSTSLPSPINADGTFLPPGSFALSQPVGDPGLSFDNLFYPDGSSAVCPPPLPGDPHGPYPFGGGVLDIYGLLFNVDGGYTVNLWSNGVLPGLGLTYGVTDAFDGARLHSFGEPFADPGVNLTTSPVPEPSSLMLLGTGVVGLVETLRRKMKS